MGAVIVKTFPLPKKQKGGVVTWIFTSSQARGLGAGGKLADAAVDFFREQGCDAYFANVEGYNSSSFKMFRNRGFSILPFGEQLRRFGPGTFGMWLRSFHFIDIGHFLWAKPGEVQKDSPALQWLVTWLLIALFSVIAFWRGGEFSPETSGLLAGFWLVLLGLRGLAMKLASRMLHYPVRFRAWESGMPLGFGIALLLGGIFPVTGNFYPKKENWTYREDLAKLGPIALAGVLPAFLLALSSWAAEKTRYFPFTELSRETGLRLQMLGSLSAVLAFFDVVLVFFPFACYSGRRIFDWKIWLWIPLAILTVLIYFF